MRFTLITQLLVLVVARTELIAVFGCNVSKNAAYAVRYLSQRSMNETNKTVTTSIPSQNLVQSHFEKNNRTEKLDRLANELRVLHRWNQGRKDSEDQKRQLNHKIMWMEKLINETHDFFKRWKFPSEDEETLMDVTMDETERTLSRFNDGLPSNVKLQALDGYSPRWTQGSTKLWRKWFAGGRHFYYCFEWQLNGKFFVDCELHEYLSGDPDVPDSVPECPYGFVRLPTGRCRNMRKSSVTDYSEYYDY